MSKLIIECENCGSEREVDEKLAGSIVSCSKCQELIRIPLPDIDIGTTIGGFVLEKQLGFGAMGEVWLAHQKTMDRKVALKILSREFTLDSHFVERFLKEVKLSAKMDHPNMITAFDAGCDNDIYYLAITFVDGFTLEDKLEEADGNVFEENDAIKIMLDIASALKYAWDEFQIIHRDIKPANIMIDRKGVGKLMDLGISKSTSEEASLTMTGTIIGTPYYMSPEQGIGERDLNFHTDIYSLGSTLYHLVTGEVPFQATTALGIVSKHITEPFPPPQEKNAALSDQCSALLEIMMAKSPEDRQNSWDDVITDMKLVLEGKFPSSKKRPDPGESLVMRAAATPKAENPEAIISNDRDTLLKDESSDNSQELGSNIFRGESHTGKSLPENKKTKIVIILTSAAAVVILALIAMFVLQQLSSGSMGNNSSQTTDDNNKNKSPEIVKNKPKVINKPTQPINKIPLPSQNESSREKRIEGMWKFASDFAKQNPDKLEVILSHFKEISNSNDAVGTKYKMMADVEISKFELKKEKAIELILKDFENKANEFDKNKNYVAGVDFFRNYSGEFADETKADRNVFVDNFLKKADQLALKKIEEEKQQKVIRQKYFKDFARKMIAGDWENAKQMIKNPPDKISMPENTEKTLDELLNIDKAVLAYINKHIDKTIELETLEGKKFFTIKKTKGSYIYYEEKTSHAVIQKKFHISKLAPEGKVKIAGLSKDAASFYLASESFKRKDLKEGISHLKNTKNFFRDIITRTLDERLAAIYLVHCLKKIDIKDTTMNPELIAQEVEAKNLSPKKLHDISIFSENFKKRFGNTDFFKKNEGVFKVLASFGKSETGNDTEDPFKKPLMKFTGQIRTIKDVHKALETVNPDYDGRGRFIMIKGKIREADLCDCRGIDNNSLDVLQVLPLKVLDLANTEVDDLTKIKDMDLAILILRECGISDIAPIKKMKTLKKLSLAATDIKSIEDIKDLNLDMLDISDTKVTDLSVLAGSNIRALRLFKCPIRDYSPLAKCRNLEFLDPVELWRRVPGKEYKADRHQPDSTRRSNDPQFYDNNRRDNRDDFNRLDDKPEF